MILSLHKLHSHIKIHNSQVRYFSSFFSFVTHKHHFFTVTCFQTPRSSFASHREQSYSTFSDTFSGIADSVLSSCSNLANKEKEFDFSNSSLKTLLLKIFYLSPETSRRFRRNSALKPEDVLQLLLGFQICGEKSEIEATKTLWAIFNRASNQDRDFKHDSRSCEVMASMLIRMGMYREVEVLFSTLESQGISLVNHEIFSNLIEGYVNNLDLGEAISMYNQMRGKGLSPSLSCYHALLGCLVRKNEAWLGFQVCMDMVDMRFELSDTKKHTFDNVIKLICRYGKIQEARTLLRKAMDFGLNPSNVVLNEIANGYCEKKDFEDALRFLTKVKRTPNVPTCNKIISSLCTNFSTERAHWFMEELIHLGFIPNEFTYGIFIGWNCHDGKLTNAFYYLSEIFSKGLTPNVQSYNAIMSGMFKEGMGKHAKDVILEMIERGIVPILSTFKALLAGYCHDRQFDEAKLMVIEMEKRGLIELSSIDDPLSKAFSILGLNPLEVRVKRDNHVALTKTEFFDSLGNGLYLDTDVDEYEKILNRVLNDSIIPDFNLMVMNKCFAGNLKNALNIVEEMVKWGQELSLPTLSTLIKSSCESNSHIKVITRLSKQMPKLFDQLDHETLNLLIQAYSKKGLTYHGKIIIDKMARRHLKITNESFTALLIGLFTKNELQDFQFYWDYARKENWVPCFEYYKPLVGFLCKQKMLKKSLELFENMVRTHPKLIVNLCNMFIEELCDTGYTSISQALVETVHKKGYILDHIASSHLIRGFIKEKRFSEAFLVFDIMLAKKLTPSLDVSFLLIPWMCRSNRIKQAMALKETCLRENVSVFVHSSLINVLCKAGEFKEAVKIFRDLLKNGLNQDHEVYNMMLQVFCQANNFCKIEELLNIMIKTHVILSFSSYRKLLKLICVNGRVFSVLHIKELMLFGRDLDHLIIYNILIYHLFQTKNVSVINTLLDEMRHKGMKFDEVTYNFLVYGFCRNGDISCSLSYLKIMISEEFKPNNRSLRAVIGCLCKIGELDQALELSHDMEINGRIHDTIVQNEIVEGLINHGKFQDAENYLNKIVEKGLIPNSINYDNLIKKFCRYGKLNKAVDLLNTMLMKENIPNSTSYDSIIQGFIACHRLDRAMDFHMEMLDMNLKPCTETWVLLADMFCEKGRTVEGEKILDLMIQICEIPSREMYRSVINRYRLENNFGKASAVIKAMQKNGYDPDFETHWSLISKLSSSNENNEGSTSSSSHGGFLSRLLSESGFSGKNNFKPVSYRGK